MADIRQKNIPLNIPIPGSNPNAFKMTPHPISFGFARVEPVVYSKEQLLSFWINRMLDYEKRFNIPYSDQQDPMPIPLSKWPLWAVKKVFYS